MSFDPWLRTAASPHWPSGSLADGRPGSTGPGIPAQAPQRSTSPPLGIEINGEPHPSLPYGSSRRTHARTPCLDDGSIRLAWVTVDNCLMDRGIWTQPRRSFSQGPASFERGLHLRDPHPQRWKRHWGFTSASPIRSIAPGCLTNCRTPFAWRQTGSGTCRLGWGRVRYPSMSSTAGFGSGQEHPTPTRFGRPGIG